MTVNPKTIQRERRIENILLNLKKHDYLTRAQIQQLNGLGGDRNANRVLKSMDDYLGSFRHGLEKVYYLNQKGRERIGSDVIRKKTQNVQHFLIRNQLFIHLGRPASWENEIRVVVNNKTLLIADAKFERKGQTVFIEADSQQTMAKNRAKIERYRHLKKISGDSFHLVWVTELESRRVKLERLMEGLSGKVFTLSEIN